MVLGGLAEKFDHKRLALEALDVRQRLAQKIESQLIAEFVGARFAIATVNGTSALHIALHLMGVKGGDLVITQPTTFVATGNAIAYCGASPVLLDVDMDSMGLSPEARKRQEELASRIDPERRKRLERAYAPPRVIPE